MASKAKKIAELVDYVSHECEAAGIRLELRNTASVVDRGTVGFFSESEKKLLVAAKDPDHIQILAHEFSHVRQWKEGVFDCDDEYKKWWEWLRGERRLDPAAVISYTRVVAECELDCEKRTVKLLEQFGLLGPAAKREYTKQANAYVLCHEIARMQGRWPVGGRTPMEIEAIWRLLPSKFIKDVGRPPDDFLIATLEQCY